MTNYHYMNSLIGTLLLVASDAGLKQIVFQDGEEPEKPGPEWSEGNPVPIREGVRQIDAYFAGQLKQFSLPLAPDGTPFQLKVWRELQNIPYGATISYGELARRVGNPKAARAVGAANRSNPLPIVVPCHRVIGRDGSLTGYGGGLTIKAALLSLERGFKSLDTPLERCIP